MKTPFRLPVGKEDDRKYLLPYKWIMVILWMRWEKNVCFFCVYKTHFKNAESRKFVPQMALFWQRLWKFNYALEGWIYI